MERRYVQLHEKSIKESLIRDQKNTRYECIVEGKIIWQK